MCRMAGVGGGQASGAEIGTDDRASEKFQTSLARNAHAPGPRIEGYREKVILNRRRGRRRGGNCPAGCPQHNRAIEAPGHGDIAQKLTAGITAWSGEVAHSLDRLDASQEKATSPCFRRAQA